MKFSPSEKKRRALATDRRNLSKSLWLTPPPSYKASAFLVLRGSDKITLYLDIDQKDHLHQVRCSGPFGAGEELESWKESFELACSFCQGLNAHEALKIKFHTLLKTQNDPQKKEVLFHPFALLLRLALSRYWGIVESPDEWEKVSFHDLLCRCFGVYRSQVIKLVLENPAIDQQELSQKTQAGMGCTSCLGALEQMIHHTREKFDLVHLKLGAFEKDGRYVRPMGLTPMQCLFKLDQALKLWLEQRSLELMISDIRGYQVILHGQCEQKDLQELSQFWEQQLGSRFTATLDI